MRFRYTNTLTYLLNAMHCVQLPGIKSVFGIEDEVKRNYVKAVNSNTARTCDIKVANEHENNYYIMLFPSVSATHYATVAPRTAATCGRNTQLDGCHWSAAKLRVARFFAAFAVMHTYSHTFVCVISSSRLTSDILPAVLPPYNNSFAENHDDVNVIAASKQRVEIKIKELAK